MRVERADRADHLQRVEPVLLARIVAHQHGGEFGRLRGELGLIGHLQAAQQPLGRRLATGRFLLLDRVGKILEALDRLVRSEIGLGDRRPGRLGIPPLNPETDRGMICGSPAMLDDTSALLDKRGFKISPRIGDPGDYVIERAFVEK